MGVQPGTIFSQEKGRPVELGLTRIKAIMSAVEDDAQNADGDAPASEGLATKSISPSRRESMKNLPKSGMHLGLGDRRGVLDSPVLLPLMTVRQQISSALEADPRTQQAFTFCIVLQEEPSPTTGISLPVLTAALGLEAGGRAFAAARSGQAAAARAEDVRSSLH